MLFSFLCPKPIPFFLKIPNIKKYLDLSESILCVSQIRYSYKFIQYSQNKGVFSYFVDYPQRKTIRTNTTIYLQNCFIKLFFAVFSIFNVIGF